VSQVRCIAVTSGFNRDIAWIFQSENIESRVVQVRLIDRHNCVFFIRAVTLLSKFLDANM
jgi:hypothetical protein